MPSVPLMQVDAFAARAFAGNPAAVCWLDAPRPEAWMQHVASEMNLSETAFLQPYAEGHPDGHAHAYALRWFTPTVEVALCGHATLASAHALQQWGRLAPGETAHFHTRSGWLSAHAVGDWIELDFPAAAVAAAEPPAGLLELLGGPPPRFCGRGQGPLGVNYLLEFDSPDQVVAVAPDFAGLSRLPMRSLVVTSAGRAPYDFTSRFFAPAGGVNEDPVTGSAHTLLTPYWAQRLGRDQLFAYQASARGGELRLRLTGDRVKMQGQAVTIFQAELLV